MTYKVLFLDMDGVLNNVLYAQHVAKKYGGWESPLTVANTYLDPKNVAALKRVVETTHCKLVISSTWRTSHSLAEFQNLFLELGFPADCVVGMTPEFSFRPSRLFDMPPATARGSEVKMYLDENPHIERYAIVDDISQFLSEQSDAFVFTDDNAGLTEADADELIAILGEGQ